MSTGTTDDAPRTQSLRVSRDLYAQLLTGRTQAVITPRGFVSIGDIIEFRPNAPNPVEDEPDTAPRTVLHVRTPQEAVAAGLSVGGTDALTDIVTVGIVGTHIAVPEGKTFALLTFEGDGPSLHGAPLTKEQYALAGRMCDEMATVMYRTEYAAILAEMHRQQQQPSGRIVVPGLAGARTATPWKQ